MGRFGTVSIPNFSFLKRALREVVKHVSEQKPGIVDFITNFLAHQRHSFFGGEGRGFFEVLQPVKNISSAQAGFNEVA